MAALKFRLLHMRMKCKQEKRDTSATAKNISECQQTILALEKKVKVLASPSNDDTRDVS